MKQLLVAVALLTASLSASATTMICGNKSQDIPFFSVTYTDTGAVLSDKGASCQMQEIPYRPNSPKYAGWKRVGAGEKNEACIAFGKSLVGDAALWLSISTEVQNGERGFAHLGAVNSADPGAGAEGKTNLSCFQAQK